MNYHNITKDDMLNGFGLRIVLWVAGCDHHCEGCQNPQTWDYKGGIPFDDNAEKELFEALDKSYISGLTISGGDPLNVHNRQEVTRIAKKFRQKYGNSKDIWVYTGYRYEDVKYFDIIHYIDILVDGEYIEELKDENCEWRGSSNQRIINLKEERLNDISMSTDTVSTISTLSTIST